MQTASADTHVAARRRPGRRVLLAAPAASIVIRTQDHVADLERNLALLAAQTVRHEVIVVDSGSEDGTRELAAAAGARVVDRSGIAFDYGATLNAGFARARADVLVSLSAYAFVPDGRWLERVLGHFRDPAVACAYGERVDEDFRPLSRPARQDAARYAVRPFWGYSNTAGAIRADLWHRRPFREDLTACEDREWARHWMQRGHVCVLDPALAVSRDYSKDPLRACFDRYHSEYSGYAAFLDLPPYELRELVAEWWGDQGGHRSRARARLDPRRAARLTGKWQALRRRSHAE